MAYRKKNYPPPNPYNRRSTGFLSSANSNRIIFGWAKGERAALKRIPFKPGENGDEQSERYWENLIKLRDDNLVLYHSYTPQDDGSYYLAMELCQGSMLDFCRGTLDSAVASLVKGIDVMWQITCAVDYLYRQKIGHGDFNLENVLFKRIESEPQRVVAKLSGYGYNYLESGGNVKTDFFKLGCLYVSAATRNEIRPSGALATWNLTEIDISAQKLSLELIHLVSDVERPFTFGAGTLLRHPFFIRHCPYALPRLINEQTNKDIRRGMHNLEKWRQSLEDVQLPNENFSDLKKILLSDDKNLETALTEASIIAPQLFSQYIWHLSTTPAPTPEGNNQKSNLEMVKSLGEGSYGKVYECYYTNKDGLRFLAACKAFKAKSGKKNSYEREITNLSQLNHLFIIKYLDVVELDDKKYMIMELCEGSLKDYVEGKLEKIPQNSLDHKIIISQVTLGLAYIHRKGIIHKDLTLENILLKRQSPESRLVLAKIADFVLAKQLRPDASEFSVTKHLGTETYMAPELLKAPLHAYPASFATDIYAFGIIIARIALKGEHPFTSDRHYRFASMAEGLVPPKLQHLSWDLIDLIVRLTDKDPAKRPIMSLVLYHPYFVLTNDKTKRHFVDHLWTHINSKENKNNSMKQMFTNHNFQEWYRTIMAETPETVEEIVEREKTLLEFKQIQPDCTMESLYGPAKHYKHKIQVALKAEYDDKIGNPFNQVFCIHALFVRDHPRSQTISQAAAESILYGEIKEKNANYGNEINETSSAHFLQNRFSRNRLHKLVQSNPALSVSYLWSRLVDVINNKPVNPSATATHQQKPISSGKRKNQLTQFKRLITNELQWVSLFYDDDEQIADELWNMKYPNMNEITQDAKKAMVRTAAKCNISTAVWSGLLKWMGTNTDYMLLHEVVQSHVPNAPKTADFILRKHWFKEENLSSFHLAAFNEGNYADEIMNTLFENNRIPTVTEDGLTPAHIAAQNETNCGWRLLKLLLDNGADPNARFQNGTTPVHWAAMNHGEHAAEILKLLLDRGGDSEKIDDNGLQPIHYATLNTSDSAITLLDVLLKKRDANVIDGTGRTLLHFAVLNEGDHAPEIMNKLLKSGENPNVGDKEGRTPLHLAIRNERIQQVESVRLLLRYHSDPNAVDLSGWTPVHYATASENEYAHEKLTLLLLCKGDLSIKDNDGLNPIHYTIINKGKYGDEMRKLVGVNREKTNAHLSNNGETLLHHLVSKKDGQLELVQMVINSGGNPNVTDKLGRSPVHSVVMMNESLAGLDMLKLLLANRGNVNLPDKEKQFTPVHYVASSLKLRVPEKMKILLNNGGNVNVKSNDGITPLHLAVANPGIYGPQLTRMLLELDANVNAIDAQQRTPLHEAIRNENDDVSFDAILQLVEKGANPNAHDSKGWTPVHYAIQHRRRNSVKVVKFLLQHGGNMKIKDNKGMTPQRLAEHCLPECLTADII